MEHATPDLVVSRDTMSRGELKGYACPIGATFFDELWLIMNTYLVKREAYLVALGCRHRLELSMVSPELVSRFQGITYGLWAKGCYIDAQRDKEFYAEGIKTLFDEKGQEDVKVE